MKTKLLTIIIAMSSLTTAFATDTLIKTETTATVNQKAVPVTSIVTLERATGVINIDPQGSNGFSILPCVLLKDGKMIYNLTCISGPPEKESMRITFSGETEKGKPVTIRTNVDGKSYEVTITLKPMTTAGKEI